MLKAYPTSARGEIDDLNVYVASLVKILSAYDDDCVRYVTHPVEGLPAKLKFIPRLAEVKVACDAYMAPILAHRHRVKLLRESREKFPELGPPPDEDTIRRVNERVEEFRRETEALKLKDGK